MEYSGDQYALKVKRFNVQRACEKLNFNRFSLLKLVKKMIKEAKILQQLHHRNISSIRGYSYWIAKDDKGKDFFHVHIGFPFYEKGDLTNLPYRQSEAEITDYLVQILKGLYYIHEKNIIHRNLIPHHIFRTKEGNQIVLKIGDFGS